MLMTRGKKYPLDYEKTNYNKDPTFDSGRTYRLKVLKNCAYRAIVEKRIFNTKPALPVLLKMFKDVGMDLKNEKDKQFILGKVVEIYSSKPLTALQKFRSDPKFDQLTGGFERIQRMLSFQIEVENEIERKLQLLGVRKRRRKKLSKNQLMAFIKKREEKEKYHHIS